MRAGASRAKKKPLARGAFVRCSRNRVLLAIRIVRRAIEAIGHSVAVAVTRPAAVLEEPAVFVVHYPAVALVAIAPALADIVARHPLVLAVAPFPVAAHEDEARTSLESFHADRRRRRLDVDVGERRNRDGARGSDERAENEMTSFHGDTS